jgi:hypothetical protein
MPPHIDAPKGLKEGFKFHQYQLNAISWMNSIENDVDKGNYYFWYNVLIRDNEV